MMTPRRDAPSIGSPPAASDGGRAGRISWQLWTWAPAVAYVALITILSHQPHPPAPLRVLPDYVMHGIEFGVLALLVGRGVYRSGRPATAATAAVVIGACALFGAVDEFHQGFIPGREKSLRDGLADAAGAFLAGSADALVRRRRRELSAGSAEVVLVGRAGCHLCDEAETVLRGVLPGFRAALTKADVTEDARLSAWADQIPVVLINGRKAFKHRVDPDRLRRRLEPWRRERGERA
jgi:VanZ family protein